MANISFSDLNLNIKIQKSLSHIGYKTPTPIQEKTIPLVLEGKDVLGIAQTGTGKTASFCLPIIHKLSETKKKLIPKSPRTLIITPTRELAIQIHTNLLEYGRNSQQKYSVIFGGVNQNKQVKDLKNGSDILVATPGRLLDLINQRFIRLDHVEIFVLDEADRMLDMGFAKDINKLISNLPKKRHNLFFSATMPPAIQKLANNILNNPKKVEVSPQASTVDKIDQKVMFVEKPDKVKLLTLLLKDKPEQKTLIFVEMKFTANRIAEKLDKQGIKSAVIHGNKSQSARQKAIHDFTNNKLNVMIATDIASRGIDIAGITHVINYQLSNSAESYVHRIGRTARAGSSGKAISLVTGDEKSFLVNVEKISKQSIPVDVDHPFHSQEAQDAQTYKVGKAKAMIERERKKELNEAYREKASNRSEGGKKSFSKKKAKTNSPSSKRKQKNNKRSF